MSDKAAPIIARKSMRDGCVQVSVAMKTWDYGTSIRVEGSANITTDQARALADELIARADEADAKVAKKAAAENRCRAWRDREVAAGRRLALTPREFFQR